MGSGREIEVDKGREIRDWRLEIRGAGEGMRPERTREKTETTASNVNPVKDRARRWGKDKRWDGRGRGVADRREGDLWAENWPIFSRSEGEYLL